ncbi:MAG: EamA family transporter [Acidobacteriota bacterium]
MAVSRVRLVAAFAAIYVFWGGTFLAIRYAVADVPPLLMMAIRCSGGAVILFGWLAVRGQLERATLAQWKVAGMAGTLLFLGCHGILAWAEQSVSSGRAALLMTSISVFLVLLSAARERRLPSRRVLLGIGLGVAGIAVLTYGKQGSAPLGAQLLLVLSDLFWAAGSLIGRHGARPKSAIQSTAMQLACGAAVLLAASLVAGEPAGWSPDQVTLRGWLSIAFLIVCGTVLAFAAYTWLLQVSTPAAVGTYSFVNPLIALGLAWAVGDEPADVRVLFAAALVLGAIFLSGEKE